MPGRPLALAVVLLAPLLAGCASPEPPQEARAALVDKDTTQLAAGRGAIAGLLLDDRLRPIADGFLLLVELGQTTRTSANGEFGFVDVPPGSYTLKTDAAGHEASPRAVDVVAGQFAEVTVIARRVASEGGSILTREYSLFIACSAGFVANGINAPCTLDGDDGYSSFFVSNLTGVENVTYVVTEIKTNQEMAYTLQLRAQTPNGTERYAAARFEGDYVKVVLQKGVKNAEHEDARGLSPNVPWNNTRPFQTIFFVDHAGREEIQGAWPENPGLPRWFTPCCGAGFAAGVRARVVQSVFVGEPEVDIAAYRVYN